MKRILRLAAILLVFVLVGPPVGALGFALLISLDAAARQVDLQGLSWLGPLALLYGIPMSYVFGLLPAVAAGLLVGIRRAYFGPVAARHALIVGGLVGLGVALSTGQHQLPIEESGTSLPETGAVLFFTCLAATMVCWLIVRRWFAR